MFMNQPDISLDEIYKLNKPRKESSTLEVNANEDSVQPAVRKTQFTFVHWVKVP